jgi:hypothetical protein
MPAGNWQRALALRSRYFTVQEIAPLRNLSDDAGREIFERERRVLLKPFDVELWIENETSQRTSTNRGAAAAQRP